MQLGELVDTSAQVSATRSRLEKIERLANLIRRLPPPLVSVGVSYLSGDLPQAPLGVGYAALQKLRQADAPPASQMTLGLDEVDGTFSTIKTARGGGSTGQRAALLGGLLARATENERHFLARLIIGELRQGALEGVMVEAVARAFAAPPAEVRRATMLAGSLPAVAVALAQEGVTALARFELRLFQPVQPMLADAAEDVGAAWERLGTAAFDFKLDGARVQVHKDGDRVEVYSRLLNNVTPAVPELVELVSRLPARRLILDGETIALSSAGRPLPFQTTMRRFGRRLDVERLRAELPLNVRFFDVLRVDDQVLLDHPLQERWQALTTMATASPDVVVPHIVAATPEQAEAFLARAFAEGHEGVMAKSLTAPYQAGRRGQEWLKIKAAHTLDLVVLAAEWGNGRRRGWLSNLHLGARDPDHGGYVMLGKTFKGMTDQVLAWQTEALLAHELGRDGIAVFVRPALVAEIAFNDVQVSSQYPGGVALRFARLKRYRPDKTPADSNTIADVRALLPAAPGSGP